MFHSDLFVIKNIARFLFFFFLRSRQESGGYPIFLCLVRNLFERILNFSDLSKGISNNTEERAGGGGERKKAEQRLQNYN